MKTLYTIFAAVCCITANCFSQCIPDIKIDGNSVIADENHPYGVKLPSWLRAGQTLERGNNVFSISVIEFTVNGTSLDYSQNLSITTPVQTVPANKVWKIESVHKNAQFTPSVVATYSVAGSYTFTPTCSGYYKIQVWGAGGGGAKGDWCYCGNVGGGGGGGGGYTEATFFLSSGTPYSATVGAGGAGGAPQSGCPNVNGSTGGTSIFNGPSSISATGGGGGIAATSCTYPSGGSGGTGSGGQANVTGSSGATVSSGNGANGGAGANGGGAGGTGGSGAGGTGVAPGGGGAGGAGLGGIGYVGGSGAVGEVIISLGGGTISSSRVPCVTLYLYGSSCAAAPACPTGWNDAGCGIGPNGSTVSYCRTCYRCD